MAPIIPVTFRAGDVGTWRIDRLDVVTGSSLAAASRLEVMPAAPLGAFDGASWSLRGVSGHQRYVGLAEQRQLAEVQAGLGRRGASCAALIPIQKSDDWWSLAQDQRRAIFEDSSHHISASLKYLPAIARRLYQSRELGEPFDFLTWFEYAPEHAALFEELVVMLRATEEWTYVVREVDIRLSRGSP